MDGFQTTVLGVAVGLLIIILAVVGVVLASNSKNMLFPPSKLPCPNYWQMNSDGKCVIPVLTPSAQAANNGTAVNVGDWNPTSANASSTTHGLNVADGTINFSDSGWGSNATSATCAKRKWAKENKIFWDGISNYNGCDK